MIIRPSQFYVFYQGKFENGKNVVMTAQTMIHRNTAII
jgi:hypothetical protein